ncbi:hypothetical protein PILCRDRAFT_818194 [Piloderma croceum F 1598]|uniref:Tetratricopeptide repeat protein 1 n=1 Tax=Piloderma croceum (strain F 1598) TaxID=765440 RepID=A0A0C3FKR7_PILCF|nr:hypothetical protein PILCRDRAFT_818194 [Piloderma croceum F 1598]
MTNFDIPSEPSSQSDSESRNYATVDASRVQENLLHAEELKLEGNVHFKAGGFHEALVSYHTALACLPPRKSRGKEKETTVEREPSDDEGESTDVPNVTEIIGSEDAEEVAESNEVGQAECAKARAVLNANIGACHVKLGDHKEAVKSCTEALLDDPKYVKALHRRAASNEQINSWSSLTSAQEDYTVLLEIVPPSSSQLDEVKRSLQLIKPRVEQAQKQETGEMLDKLKGLGNSLLGNFGLSTDNFKFEPNGQGGYSMNFVR